MASQGVNKRYIPISAVVQTDRWIIFTGEVGRLNGSLIAGGIFAEFQAIVRDMRQWLACSPQRVGLESTVHATVYVLHTKDVALIQDAWRKAFGDSGRLPRIVVAKTLSVKGAHVEVDAVAYTHVPQDYNEDDDPR